ncbi:MAG: hypothetical protein JNM21_17635 [Taibaiella sp.]|nr:hypothetical protein [Taibaiella sp.]
MARLLLLFCFVLGLWACESAQVPEYPQHLADCYRLHELTRKKTPAQPGDWLYNKPEEMHQSLKAYIASGPLKADSIRKKLYLVKIGTFDSQSQKIFEQALAYLSAYFQITADTIPGISEQQIPEQYKRVNQGQKQWKSIYILDSLLPRYRPGDAFALIAFTATDLYPDEAWNFVFGQAKLHAGLGVWSLARLGLTSADRGAYQLALQRALKIASHETGHMFSITHCVKNECNMNGSNSMPESDAQPEWLCWECLAKICYNRDVTPQAHLRSLLAFHQRIGADTATIRYYKTALRQLQIPVR